VNHIIQTEGLTKRFGQVTALDGVDLAVPEGSICGFLGPNGAGKTTTLKILLGLLAQSEGSAKLFGREVSLAEPAAFKREVGYLPQDPVFPPRMSGLEVLQFVADTYRMGGARKRIHELLDRFDLADAARREVARYSRGMKQRLGLAAALLPEPRLLLLDEPVSALDPEGRFEALQLISGMRDKCTVFFSTHILADVERTCDRVVMIHRGKVVAEERLQDLLRRYSTEQYELRVEDGREDDALDLARSMPPVREAVLADGVIRLTAKHGQLDGLRRSVVKALASEDIMVVDFHLVKRTLESVFLDVVAASGVAASNGAGGSGGAGGSNGAGGSGGAGGSNGAGGSGGAGASNGAGGSGGAGASNGAGGSGGAVASRDPVARRSMVASSSAVAPRDELAPSDGAVSSRKEGSK